ncbi:hypothetical protein QNI16_37415 [Cytophagaceae bacterium YF14B1]|uniref:Uncharacterized protein n=1 Tax=Xanthocytophaga flava TaxID=3048013 RepID=A0AAE3QZD6_9BACT|nr:hypothetical protein [Xanthocytophaga flavus]MDJ1486223.1 hypothetical protein [Xanthocytophaga flavus]
MFLRFFVLLNILLVPFLSKAQRISNSDELGTIITKGGDTLIGDVKQRDSGLLFRSTDNASDKKRISYTDVASFQIGKNKYVYFGSVYKVEKEGKKIGLYSKEITGTNQPTMNTTLNTYYYFKRPDESRLTQIRAVGVVSFKASFKTTVQKYFSDCPDLQRLIEQETFGKNQLVEIVDYYESYCSN